VDKRRVALICSPHLLGESLIQLLGNLEDVSLLGPWPVAKSSLLRLVEAHPDLVLFATESEDPPQEQMHFVSEFLEACPNLPLVRATLADNCLRVYTTQTLPARSTDLIELIRRLKV
jgi:hypothetical protein